MRGEFPQPGRSRVLGPGPECGHDRACFDGGQGTLGHLDKQLPLGRVGQTQHGLTLSDDLPGLRQHGGDQPRSRGRAGDATDAGQ